MTPQINIHLSEEALQRFQQAKSFVNETMAAGTESVQQISDSWKNTATQASDQAINTVNTSFEQAKTSLEQTLQTAGQIPSSTSSAIQTVISDSVDSWINNHPIIVKLLQILDWATHHPIISLILLLFAISIGWSIIKAIVRLIETASWSLVQIPFKLCLAAIKFIFLFLGNVSSLVMQKTTANKNIEKLPVLLPEITTLIHKEKEERLTEISHRLTEIQQEQQKLLQEAAEILATNNIDINIETNHTAKNL